MDGHGSAVYLTCIVVILLMGCPVKVHRSSLTVTVDGCRCRAGPFAVNIVSIAVHSAADACGGRATPSARSAL